MSGKITDSLKYSNELETKLNGKLFLGGGLPSAEDTAAFNKLIGDGNTALARWVKHMASFTPSERAAWVAPVAVEVPVLKEC